MDLEYLEYLDMMDLKAVHAFFKKPDISPRDDAFDAESPPTLDTSLDSSKNPVDIISSISRPHCVPVQTYSFNDLRILDTPFVPSPEETRDLRMAISRLESQSLTLGADISSTQARLSSLQVQYTLVTSSLSVQKALVAPIRKIPEDILFQIFQTYCALEDTTLNLPWYPGPLLLIQVCRQWRRLALDMAELWGELVLTSQSHVDPFVIVPLYIQHARTLDLQLKQWEFDSICRSYLYGSVIGSHDVVLRLRTLCITDAHELVNTISPLFPNLTTLRIRGIGFDIPNRLLGRCPALEELEMTFQNGICPKFPKRLPRYPLRRLIINWFSAHDATPLLALFPATQVEYLHFSASSLRLRSVVWPWNEFEAFLGRNWRLKELNLSGIELPREEDELITFVGQLRYLEVMVLQHTKVPGYLLTLLALDAIHILPQLKELQLVDVHMFDGDMLIEVITTRAPPALNQVGRWPPLVDLTKVTLDSIQDLATDHIHMLQDLEQSREGLNITIIPVSNLTK